MNDGIDSEICSLSYVTVDEAAKAILLKGNGALLAKVDIKTAYRIVPVHPERQVTSRNAMGGGPLRGCSSPLRPPISTQDLFSNCRCSRVEDEVRGSRDDLPLFG